MTTARFRSRRLAAGLLTAGLLALTACSNDDDASPAPTTATTAAPGEGATTTAPPSSGNDVRYPTPDWPVEEPEDHGIDPAALEAVREYAFAEGSNTQGVVVIHDEAIVAEWYADGADAGSWAASWSMAKSIASTTVGIAIGEGLIPGVDEPMTTWYPELADAGLGDLTLRHVLQMDTGQEWNEDYDPTQGISDVIQLVVAEGSQLEYALGRPKEVEPGTRFHYSSGTSMLLSGVLEQATGRSAGDYANEKLFEPIGMSKIDWWEDTTGDTLTYCCVDTTSRDFARLGLLFLHGGRWGDEQVVPEAWVRESLTPSPTSEGSYGYQWWLTDVDGLPEDTFAARGFDGQHLWVVPGLDLIVVRNGTYVKDDGPPVADPSLFETYPPSGLVEGKGTRPPDIEDWDSTEILRRAVAAVEDAEPAS